MVGPVVDRLVPALWRSAVPISAAALDDDHGQGTAPLFRHCNMAAVFRPDTDLWLYFEQTTEQLIREAIHADTADAETTVEPARLR
jgi:hypothetical protein